MPGWGPARHGGGPRQRGRPRRIRRFIEPAILLLLHASANHGYGILAGMSEMGLDSYPADISAIYRALHDLESQGMVVSSKDAVESAGPPRRVYRLTEKGDRYLSDWVSDLRETERVLRRFLAAYEAHSALHDAPSDTLSGATHS